MTSAEISRIAAESRRILRTREELKTANMLDPDLDAFMLGKILGLRIAVRAALEIDDITALTLIEGYAK